MSTQRNMRADITAEEVRRVVDYDPETGLFHHKAGRKWVKEGTQAATAVGAKGYHTIAFYQRSYMAHRIAWLYHYGEWPGGLIDHINRVKTDNRIANLRVATQTQNCANSPAQKGNKAGAKGVYYLKKKKLYMARIKDHGKGVYLGRFKKLEDAQAAYERAAKRIHGEFAYILSEQA